MKRSFSIGVLLLLAGCAYIDQNMQVAPQVTVIKTNIGKGKKIALRVVDDREDQEIGRRANGYGFKAAKISTNQNLDEILQKSFTDGVQDKGFEAVRENDSKTTLRVELRTLSYDTAMGIWTGGNIGKSTIKVIATDPSGKTYEKSYHGEQEIRTVFIGSQETNAKVVNEALTVTLEKIFTDTKLWEFLAQ